MKFNLKKQLFFYFETVKIYNCTIGGEKVHLH